MNESCAEVLSTNVIVLHPGSLYLRLGRGSDTSCCSVLHAVARRRRQGGTIHQDPLLIPQANLDGRTWENLTACQNQLFQALGRVKRRDGNLREVPDPASLLHLNTHSHPEPIHEQQQASPGDTCIGRQDVVVGDDILQVSNISSYNIHFPYRRGDFNIHSGVGGSVTSVLLDLQEIWTQAISQQLGINQQDFPLYKVIVIIPTVYKRPHVKQLVNLLLLSMRFAACFPLQEDVAAIFGAGLQAACVLDLGDQKCSVSCVEDSQSIPATRMHLDYGGSDITQIFYHFWQRVGFPHQALSPLSLADGLLLHSLKESCCSLNIDTVGLARHVFIAGRPEHRYNLYTGDEVVAAPFALFQVELLELTGSKSLRLMSRDPGDPEDPHDHIFLRETSRKYNKTGDIQGEEQEFEEVDQQGDNPAPDIVNQPALALDQAVLRSVEPLTGEETKRKMFSNILLVGGGARLTGLAAYLQSKLNTQVSGGVEVLVDPRDVGVDSVVWRGGAVLSNLETAQELWIRPGEWARHGQKILRERSLFSWA